jgi:CheY-like chemotaxis protein
LNPHARTSQAGKPQSDKTLAPSKVLVVDDNAQNLELLCAYMEEVPNVTTIPASNGMECLAKVAQEQPDLILLDIMMPKMSGFEVCNSSRATRRRGTSRS